MLEEDKTSGDKQYCGGHGDFSDSVTTVVIPYGPLNMEVTFVAREPEVKRRVDPQEKTLVTPDNSQGLHCDPPRCPVSSAFPGEKTDFLKAAFPGEKRVC